MTADSERAETTPRVNYDAIAPTYDQRRDESDYSPLNRAVRGIAEAMAARRILDLGCGTGRSLDGVAHADVLCVGLDLSPGMLSLALKHDPAYRLVQASADLPPFRPQSFDLVFSTLAFHHFPNQQQVVTEAYELLRPGGGFAVVTLEPREMKDWYGYQYFEGVYETDLRRFLPIGELADLMRRAGFGDVRQELVLASERKVINEEVLTGYFTRKDSCSQFALLSDEAYEAALRRIRAWIEEARRDGEDAVFVTVDRNWMCWGLKP